MKIHFRENVEKLYNAEKGGSFDIHDIVPMFPKMMRNDIIRFVYQDAIQEVWFLKKRPE